MSIVDWLSQSLISACGVEGLQSPPTGPLNTLEWMEHSALGVCISQSWGGYYIMLGFHALGLSIIVGAMMVLDLRVFGIARGISAQALPKFVTIGWWGFWVNAISGVALLFSEATKMYPDHTFRWKLFLILIGMITTYVFNRTILKPAAALDPGLLNTTSAKLQATFSVAIWLAVIITGRMIAYLGAGPG